MRAGYILEIYDQTELNRFQQSIDRTLHLPEHIACVWQCLFEKLTKSKHIFNDELHSKTRKSMQELADKIMKPNQSLETTNMIDADVPMTDWNTTLPVKRKYSTDSNDSTEDCGNKKSKITDNVQLDILLPDHRIPNKFNHVFNQLQIIQLKDVYEEFENNHEAFKFNFDLYVYNGIYKKSCPGLPNFRIIVLKDEDVAPTRSQILKLYLEQKHRVPIIVVFVNELMAMNAFVYNCC